MPPPQEVPVEKAVEVDEVDYDLYRSLNLWQPVGMRGIFGGQVIAQSLLAASRTVPPEYTAHSLHCYFELHGDANSPIFYRVAHGHDGKSYCNRTVHATQRGKNIYVCELSFQTATKTSVEHQIPMPKTVGPEASYPRTDIFEAAIKDPKIQPELIASIRLHTVAPFDLEFRETDPISTDKIRQKEPLEARYTVWIRTKHRMPHDVALHQAVAAYATDHFMMGTSLRPKGREMWDPNETFAATLDHCMWFHSSFRIDEWILFEVESPRATNGRGFILGRMYDQEGNLVISCAQECTLRIFDKANSKL